MEKNSWQDKAGYANVDFGFDGVWQYRIPSYLKGGLEVGDKVVTLVGGEYKIGTVTEFMFAAEHGNLLVIVDKVDVARHAEFLLAEARKDAILKEIEERRAVIEAVESFKEAAGDDDSAKGILGELGELEKVLGSCDPIREATA